MRRRLWDAHPTLASSGHNIVRFGFEFSNLELTWNILLQQQTRTKFLNKEIFSERHRISQPPSAMFPQPPIQIDQSIYSSFLHRTDIYPNKQALEMHFFYLQHDRVYVKATEKGQRSFSNSCIRIENT